MDSEQICESNSEPSVKSVSTIENTALNGNDEPCSSAGIDGNVLPMPSVESEPNQNEITTALIPGLEPSNNVCAESMLDEIATAALIPGLEQSEPAIQSLEKDLNEVSTATLIPWLDQPKPGNLIAQPNGLESAHVNLGSNNEPVVTSSNLENKQPDSVFNALDQPELVAATLIPGLDEPVLTGASVVPELDHPDITAAALIPGLDETEEPSLNRTPKETATALLSFEPEFATVGSGPSGLESASLNFFENNDPATALLSPEPSEPESATVILSPRPTDGQTTTDSSPECSEPKIAAVSNVSSQLNEMESAIVTKMPELHEIESAPGAMSSGLNEASSAADLSLGVNKPESTDDVSLGPTESESATYTETSGLSESESATIVLSSGRDESQLAAVAADSETETKRPATPGIEPKRQSTPESEAKRPPTPGSESKRPVTPGSGKKRPSTPGSGAKTSSSTGSETKRPPTPGRDIKKSATRRPASNRPVSSSQDVASERTTTVNRGRGPATNRAPNVFRGTNRPPAGRGPGSSRLTSATQGSGGTSRPPTGTESVGANRPPSTTRSAGGNRPTNSTQGAGPNKSSSATRGRDPTRPVSARPSSYRKPVDKAADVQNGNNNNTTVSGRPPIRISKPAPRGDGTVTVNKVVVSNDGLPPKARVIPSSSKSNATTIQRTAKKAPVDVSADNQPKGQTYRKIYPVKANASEGRTAMTKTGSTGTAAGANVTRGKSAPARPTTARPGSARPATVGTVSSPVDKAPKPSNGVDAKNGNAKARPASSKPTSSGTGAAKSPASATKGVAKVETKGTKSEHTKGKSPAKNGRDQDGAKGPRKPPPIKISHIVKPLHKPDKDDPFRITCAQRCGGEPEKKKKKGNKKNNTPPPPKPVEEKKPEKKEPPPPPPTSAFDSILLKDFKDPYVNKLMKEEFDRDHPPAPPPPKPKPYFPLVPPPTIKNSDYELASMTEEEPPARNFMDNQSADEGKSDEEEKETSPKHTEMFQSPMEDEPDDEEDAVAPY